MDGEIRRYNDYNQRRVTEGLPVVSLEQFRRDCVEIATEVSYGLGEVRTESSTGGQKGVKPERYDLIPTEPLAILARLYGFGAEKYAAHNFRKGYEWSKSYAALQRHANQFWGGEDIDEETQLPHMASVAFHAFALICFMQDHPEFDDRYKGEDLDLNVFPEFYPKKESLFAVVEAPYRGLLRCDPKEGVVPAQEGFKIEGWYEFKARDGSMQVAAVSPHGSLNLLSPTMYYEDFSEAVEKGEYWRLERSRSN